MEKNPDGSIKKYRADFKIPNSIYVSKTFSVTKWGNDLAFKKAIDARLAFEKEYDYQYTEEGSETKSDIQLSDELIPISDTICKLMTNSIGKFSDKEIILYR